MTTVITTAKKAREALIFCLTNTYTNHATISRAENPKHDDCKPCQCQAPNSSAGGAVRCTVPRYSINSRFPRIAFQIDSNCFANIEIHLTASSAAELLLESGGRLHDIVAFQLLLDREQGYTIFLDWKHSLFCSDRSLRFCSGHSAAANSFTPDAARPK